MKQLRSFNTKATVFFSLCSGCGFTLLGMDWTGDDADPTRWLTLVGAIVFLVFGLVEIKDRNALVNTIDEECEAAAQAATASPARAAASTQPAPQSVSHTVETPT